MQIAVCQMTSTADVEANLAVAEKLVREAASRGARLACLPEYFSFYGAEADWKRAAREITPGVLKQMSSLAGELGVHLSLGSVLEDVAGSLKCANTSVMLGPDGCEIARYRKMRLFDVDLPDRAYRESDLLVAGGEPVVCEVEGWRVGLSICYDLRFPQHYAALRRMGAELVLIPSAFTAVTGRAHWGPLVRSRAIETQCFVAAAAQVGECGPGRTCHGHAMIADPWGTVLAEAGGGVSCQIATLDRQRLAEVRRNMPMEWD